MSDVVSIELVLDPQTEVRVREIWARLAAAGLPSMAGHKGASNRPHVTLLVRPALATVDFSAAIAQLPIAVELDAPLVFRHGDRCVLALRVAPSDDLRRLHRTVHGAAPAGDDARHTTPADWTPHVTLARRLPVDRLADALQLVETDIAGTAVALRRWDSASATVTPLG